VPAFAAKCCLPALPAPPAGDAAVAANAIAVGWHGDEEGGGGERRVWALLAAGPSEGTPPFKDIAFRALRLPLGTAEELAGAFSRARGGAARGGLGGAAPAGLEEHLLADREAAARGAFVDALRAAGVALRAAARGGAPPPAGEAKEVEDAAAQVPFDAPTVAAAAALFNTGGGAEVNHAPLCRWLRLQLL
jgi:hypothetical protein